MNNKTVASREIEIIKDKLTKYIDSVNGRVVIDIGKIPFHNGNSSIKLLKEEFTAKLSRILNPLSQVSLNDTSKLANHLRELLKNSFDAISSFSDTRHSGTSFMPHGYIIMTLQIISDAAQEKLIVRISDNGMGKSSVKSWHKEENQYRYFGHFGLGLKSVAEYLEDLDGSLDLRFNLTMQHWSNVEVVIPLKSFKKDY